MIERFEDFCEGISMAYKCIIKIKSREMEKYGLKAAHTSCLYFLGKHKDGLTATELCELCREDKAGVSKALSALKENGFASLNADGDKVYKGKYKITESGYEKYESMENAIKEVIDAAGGSLTDEERSTFYGALFKIVENLSLYSERND